MKEGDYTQSTVHKLVEFLCTQWSSSWYN